MATKQDQVPVNNHLEFNKQLDQTNMYLLVPPNISGMGFKIEGTNVKKGKPGDQYKTGARWRLSSTDTHARRGTAVREHRRPFLPEFTDDDREKFFYLHRAGETCGEEKSVCADPRGHRAVMPAFYRCKVN